MDRDQTTSSALAESPETLGYLNLWQIVRRRKWRVLLGVFTCLILGTAYLVLSGPQYESTAAVLVLKKRLETAPISGPNQDPRQLEDYLATHMQVITSPRVVRQAVTKHKLADLQCFEGKKDVTKAIVDALTVTRDTRKPGVSPSNEILTIGFRGKEPDECSTVLMAVIDSYQDFLKETYRNINAETLDLIARARDVVQKDLDALEAEYQRFRENTPPLWKGKEGITVQQERLFTLDARRSALRSRQAALKATLTAIDGSLKNGRGYAEFLDIAARLPANREVVAPSLLTQPEPWMAGKSARVSLEEELVNLQLQESKLLENYGSDHPDVQAIRKRIETVRGMIAPAAAARGQVPAQSSRVRELVDLRIQLLKQEFEDNEREDRSLATLFEADQKEAKTAVIHETRDESYRQRIERGKQLHESIIKRLQEIDSVRDYGGYDTHILAPPERGELATKRILLTIGGALFMGLVLGFGWAFLVDMSDKSFRSPKEIRSRLGLPVVGHIPVLKPAPEALSHNTVTNGNLDPLLCTYYRSNSAEAEAYRALRTALCFGTHAEGRKIIQVTSPNEGDGKTTVAANLAVSLAQSGQKVVLIDADFRQPRLHKVFGVANDVGLSSFLADRAETAAAIRATGIPGLSILPSGPVPVNPAELLASPRLKVLFESLRTQFDFVLIDSPPLLAVTDPCIVVAQVDGVLLGLRLSKDARPLAERAKEILDGLGTPVLGVVINGVHHRPISAGYDYEPLGDYRRPLAYTR